MNFRIFFAGLAGGVAMFVWGFVAHMLLPLGEAGIRTLPYQAKVLPAVTESVKAPGLYIFPWPESPPGTPLPVNADTRKAAEELYKTSPHGLLLFYPPPAPMLTGGQLLTEFATNCLSSLIASALVVRMLASLRAFAARVMLVAAIGLSAGVAVNVPHWNWYGFPVAFTLGEIVEHVVGFAVAGLVIAVIIKPLPGQGTPSNPR